MGCLGKVKNKMIEAIDDPLEWINMSNLCYIFVPVPRQDLDFQCHMSWSFCVR